MFIEETVPLTITLKDLSKEPIADLDQEVLLISDVCVDLIFDATGL